MSVNFSVGPATLALVNPDPPFTRTVRRMLDPYGPTAAPIVPADLYIDRSGARPDVAEIQGDAGDGVVSGMYDTAFCVFTGRDWWALRLQPDQSSLTLSEHTPAWRVIGPVVRPILQLALHRHEAIAVHGSSASINGSGVLVAGWSESGKTEIVLALLEGGARFVSDKWTIVATDGMLSAFPAPVFVRRWVLRYLPRLAASFGPRPRAQLLAGRLADGFSGPVRRLGAMGPTFAFASSTFLRAVGVADGIRLRPSQVRSTYGESGPPIVRTSIDAVVLLTTVPPGPPTVKDLDPRAAARRMARSAAFERRGYYELAWRMSDAGPASLVPSPERDVDFESRFLEDWLRRVPAIEVRAPFPADPRRIADLITATLPL